MAEMTAKNEIKSCPLCEGRGVINVTEKCIVCKGIGLVTVERKSRNMVKTKEASEMLELTELITENMVLINGRWVPAKPLQIKTLWMRIKDAYAVLIGKAEAVTWNG